MVRFALFSFLLLGGCRCKNYASTYAETLDPKASCYLILTDSDSRPDFAECKISETESWYCHGGSVQESKCYLIGPQVRIHVDTTPAPAEKVP